MPHYMPIMMNLFEQRCVVVGGGTVAERKTQALLEAGAKTVVISPSATAWLQERSEDNKIEWVKRRFCKEDLVGAFLAFAATDQKQVNAEIVREAMNLGIPVNDTSQGERGSFITPSVVRRGGLIVAVSTSGAGPSASRRLSQEIDERFGDDYETYIDFLSAARSLIKRRVAESSQRKHLLRLLAEMDILTLIREGSFEPWSEETVIAWIDQYRGNLE